MTVAFSITGAARIADKSGKWERTYQCMKSRQSIQQLNFRNLRSGTAPINQTDSLDHRARRTAASSGFFGLALGI